ncbi:PQQ-dependent sugar dehydrogenase [Xylanimonas ulmi]|uniref:Glucose/arabinose dehydrogenase n=1 Tax=Xylanimonas ulmi TaxID=228973 RepID=A0A4Q7M713_9MICO|nr:PQQ-dependent sugar dehydrogenase [Xylanibacterium ulmi]RZS61889.1 glucose/arabinose dehydrogenase [Xylanibacterium ulmi]
MDDDVRGLARRIAALVAAAALTLLVACDPDGHSTPADPAASAPAPPPAPAPPTAPAPGIAPPPAAVTATATTVASRLRAPWGLALLPDGRLLVTLRDEARLVVVDPDDGSVTAVVGPGAERLARETRPAGEGGLLGVALQPQPVGAVVPAEAADGPLTVFLYRTGADDNAVVRAPLTLTARGQAAPAPSLGALTTVLDGVRKAANHDGGRLAFGPDGYLYVTTGDAGDRPSAQDPHSLNGKILRVTTDGDPAPGNPFPDSPVWSLGHRNVQGIGWDAQRRMFASEFGQDTWDELNQIVRGGNYGWPLVEGAGAGAAGPAPGGGPAVVDGYTQPLVVWPTRDASPSGLAVTPDAIYLAALRGQRLWRVPWAPGAGPAAVPLTQGEETASPLGLGEPQALLTDEGRLRAVVADPDGSLWVLTNNTDGRGEPREGDDRLLHVTVSGG